MSGMFLRTWHNTTRMTHPTARSLDEIQRRAHADLRRNPTITVYTYTRDGLELRRRVYPFARLTAMFEGVADAFTRLGAATNEMRQLNYLT